MTTMNLARAKVQCNNECAGLKTILESYVDSRNAVKCAK